MKNDRSSTHRYPAYKNSGIEWLGEVPEQKTIAHYLDTKTGQIDQIIQTINTQIEKLKELRKTLINDVVTGKNQEPRRKRTGYETATF